jgi:hypothetical protein
VKFRYLFGPVCHQLYPCPSLIGVAKSPITEAYFKNPAYMALAIFEGLPVVDPPEFVGARVLQNVGNFEIEPPVTMFRAKGEITKFLSGYGFEEVRGLKDVYEGRAKDFESWKKVLEGGIEQTRGKPGVATPDATTAFFVCMRFALLQMRLSRAINDNRRTFFRSYKSMRAIDLTDANMTIDYPNLDKGVTTTSERHSLHPTLTHGYFNLDIEPIFPCLAQKGEFPKFPPPASLIQEGDEGFFAPYWSGMSLDDKEFTWRVIEEFFMPLLVQDPDNLEDMVSTIRGGLRQLASTPQGHIVNHVFWGIRASIRGGHRFFPIRVRNNYKGFLLLDIDWVRVGGRKVLANDAASLLSSLDLIYDHDVKLAEILSIVATVIGPDGGQKYHTADIKTSRQLSNLMCQVSRMDLMQPQWDQIIEKANSLYFEKDSFAKPTVGNMLLALRFIETGDITLIEEFGAFLGKGMIAKPGIVSRAFGIFGDSCPSINIGQGQKSRVFTIPKKGTPNDGNLEIRDGRRVLVNIPVKIRKTQDAVVEWDRLLTSRNLRLPAEGKKDFVNPSEKDWSIGGLEFDEVYKALKSAMEVTAVSTDGKRKRADEVGEGSKAKKGRLDIDKGKRVVLDL